MRRKTLGTTRQPTLPFVRHEIWGSIPLEHRRQCRELLVQLLRAVLQDEEPPRQEEKS
jgi:hypothetical protein